MFSVCFQFPQQRYGDGGNYQGGTGASARGRSRVSRTMLNSEWICYFTLLIYLYTSTLNILLLLLYRKVYIFCLLMRPVKGL